MRLIIKTMFLLAINICVILLNVVIACALPNNDNEINNSIRTENGYIYFQTSLFKVNEVDTMNQITVQLYDCNTHKTTKIDDLSVTRDKGIIKAAFLADANFDGIEELFIIHAMPLPSTAEYYFISDDYRVLIYDINNSLNNSKKEIIKYFNSELGIDSKGDDKNIYLNFTYPYKTKESITKSLNSNMYKKLQLYKTINIILNKKTFIYTEAHVSYITKMYLIKDDVVQVIDKSGGWLQINFKNPNKGNIKGWIKCQDVNQC